MYCIVGAYLKTFLFPYDNELTSYFELLKINSIPISPTSWRFKKCDRINYKIRGREFRSNSTKNSSPNLAQTRHPSTKNRSRPEISKPEPDPDHKWKKINPWYNYGKLVCSYISNIYFVFYIEKWTYIYILIIVQICSIFRRKNIQNVLWKIGWTWPGKVQLHPTRITDRVPVR